MTQPLIGLFIDTHNKEKMLVLLSLIITITGSLIYKIPYLSLVLLGLGNSLFHTAGGKITIDALPNKLSLLGIFVSLGVIGLTIGTLYYQIDFILTIFITVTLLCGILLYLINRDNKEIEKTNIEVFTPNFKNVGVILIILLLVMFRGIIGKYTVFSWTNTNEMILYLAIAIALGKALGGIVADLIGIRWTITVSGIISVLFLVLGRDNLILGSLGIFFFNMAMPITLYLLYKQMGEYRANAFGLAAMIIFPGLDIVMYLQEKPELYDIILITTSVITISAIILLTKEVRKNEIS